ncbi:hypothetical protein D3C80_1894990 [compost metagenome]
MAAEFRLGVVAHQVQRLVDGVFGHRLPVVVVASKDQFVVSGELVNLFQQLNGLAAQWHQMGCTHLGAPM